MNEQLIQLNHMARRLRVPVRWLMEQAESGKIPALKTGKTYLVNPEAVIDVLTRRAKEGEQ